MCYHSVILSMYGTVCRKSLAFILLIKKADAFRQLYETFYILFLCNTRKYSSSYLADVLRNHSARRLSEARVAVYVSYVFWCLI